MSNKSVRKNEYLLLLSENCLHSWQVTPGLEFYLSKAQVAAVSTGNDELACTNLFA